MNNAADLSIVLRGAKIVDPDGARPGTWDLWIEKGVLRGIGAEIRRPDLASIDLGGRTVVPGLFDMHVNLREPGGEDAETIATGAEAAARGGFTAIACMPSTPVPNDTRAVIDLIHVRAHAACGVRIHPVGAITKGLQGEQLTEMWELKDTGAVAVSDDGFPTESSEVMRRGMEYASMCDLPVLAHCDDRQLRGNGVMNEGYWSTVLGLRGIPVAAEEVAVARNIALAELTGCKLHILHLSTARGVELVRQAKSRELPVTAEVSPHHLTFVDDAVREYEARFKMNPPLRTESDRAALRSAILDGTIDAIATDHAPHTNVAIEVEFDQAPFGVIGLDTGFAASYRVLAGEEDADLALWIDRLTWTPRRILGLEPNRIEEGQVADLTVLDLEASGTVDPQNFGSLARNCPFNGETLPTEVVATVAEGRLVHTSAAWSAPALTGQTVPLEDSVS